MPIRMRTEEKIRVAKINHNHQTTFWPKCINIDRELDMGSLNNDIVLFNCILSRHFVLGYTSSLGNFEEWSYFRDNP